MFEIRVKGTFVTGSTAEDKEMAEAEIKKVLLEGLKKIHFCQDNGVFNFKIEEIKSEKL